MVGNYGQPSSAVLEFRQPARIFVLLGWLGAGILNPAAYFAYMLWGMPEFNYQIWTWHAAAPLELGVLFALMFLREGGYGIAAVAIFTIFSILAACAVSGPVYAFTTWAFQQNNISLGMLGWYPIHNFDTAIAVSGTYIRASLIFAGVAAIPAVIILRIIAFQRVRPKPKASPSAQTPAPAA
jgi:hypothetical protein